jgi:hypothetical protein
MSTTTTNRFRFNLKSAFVLFALIAVLLVCSRWWYEWYYATPTMPLADAVARFNSEFGQDEVGRFESPLTDIEVLTAIRSQLPNLPASDQVKSIFAKIVRTQLVPQDASIYAMRQFQARNRTEYTVWWINLDIKVGKNFGYGLRIRENNAPTAKPKGEPPLTRP